MRNRTVLVVLKVTRRKRRKHARWMVWRGRRRGRGSWKTSTGRIVIVVDLCWWWGQWRRHVL